MRVPEFPIMSARKFAEFVRNFLFGKQIGKIAVALKQTIFRSAIEIKKRQIYLFYQRILLHDLKDIVLFARFAVCRAIDFLIESMRNSSPYPIAFAVHSDTRNCAAERTDQNEIFPDISNRISSHRNRPSKVRQSRGFRGCLKRAKFLFDFGN